ncbi:MAG: hypothetical protein A2X56_10520 [Nitrospirae bacterium GWC2_57_13]|nr:MAG: hypothetical protein A2X56_10520 [Nitrospirae bacterium GWC2_57_13]OGW46822.1 MAG: hypothetical protein A2X57_11185 [Nitrospirae bacterium GWD2_57_8]
MTIPAVQARCAMLNSSASKQLQTLFVSESWREHFSILSDTLGFHLSAYTEQGEQILSVGSHTPFCARVMSCAELSRQCDTYCTSAMMGVLKLTQPLVYKCYAKIMSFAFSVEYLRERAVILGQGSFAGYQDFRDFMGLIESCGVEQLSVTTPLQFTDADHVRKVCALVESSVNHLLYKGEESFTLQQKIETLKDVMGRWSSSGREEPESHYEHMLTQLLALLDIQSITILSPDRQSGRYASLYGMKRDGGPAPHLTLKEHDPVVRELGNGRPSVSYLDACAAGRQDFSGKATVFYFFPIVVSRKLVGIVAIFDSVLSPGDMNIISSFCRQTAISIENHRLHHDLYRKFDRFAAISEVSKGITSIVNFDVLAQTILERSADLLRAEQGSLLLMDQEAEALLLEAWKGLAGDITEKLKIRKGEGIAGTVAALGEPYLVRNVENDPRIMKKNLMRYKTPSFVSVPLKVDGRVIGVLNLSDKEGGEPFNDEDLELLQSFATHAAVVMERNQLFAQSETLKRLSITDPLTGLLNRRYLLDRLEDEISRAGRHGRALSILMLDIDGFKSYNDTYGHATGDKALIIIADSVMTSIRAMDIAARFGGDELVVILPETDKALALIIAERLRKDASAAELPGGQDAATGILMTVSIGIACYPEHGMTAQTLLETADKALYRAKHGGRNRIEVYS